MKIAVVIVTYNAEKWIPFCFNSLRQNTVPFEVIIIDNASKDNTVAILKSNFPEFELIVSEKNLGFGRANNIGISKAYKNGCDFVFLLNQDACVEPDTIQRITEIHKSNLEFGIISPIHLAENGNVVDKTFLSYISEKKSNAMISDIMVGKKVNTIYEFPFINAAIWSVSKTCIEQVGAFDELFSHYGEDTDYCNRVLKKGLKIGVAPHIKAIHNRSQEPSRVTVNYSNKLFITYLLFFKNFELPLSKLILKHISHTLKFFVINLFKLKFTVLATIIKVNLNLVKSRRRIILSRKEQHQHLAFLNINNN